jgi:hypothetical protein
MCVPCVIAIVFVILHVLPSLANEDSVLFFFPSSLKTAGHVYEV